jgi:hypothetical protein
LVPSVETNIRAAVTATAAKSRLSAQRIIDVMGSHLSAMVVELKAALVKQNETATPRPKRTSRQMLLIAS